MSRYNARVRADAGLTGHFACDSLNVDGGGNLSLNLQRSPDEVVTVARFQHGHWSSYELDVEPEPEPDSFAEHGNQLRAKEAAELAALTADWHTARDAAGSPAVQAVFDLHNPRRRYQTVECDHCQLTSGPTGADHAVWPCDTYSALTTPPRLATTSINASAASEPTPPPLPTPHADDTVHFLAPGRPGCTVAFVYRVNTDGSLVLWPCLDAGPYPRDIVEDQAAQCATSWHWPCDGTRGPAPATDGPALNATVQIHIDGPTLHAAVNKQLLAEYRAYTHMFRR